MHLFDQYKLYQMGLGLAHSVENGFEVTSKYAISKGK